MLDSTEEIICRGTSAWLLLDSKSKRPRILPELFPDIKMNDSIDALSNLPKKIIPSSELKSIYKTQIRYSDIDLNQHANNAKYIELMLDCFDKQFHKENTIKSLTVSFNAESKFGDEIQLFKGVENENPVMHYIQAKNETSDKIVFQSIVEWN